MKKRILCFLFAALLILPLFASCKKKQEGPTKEELDAMTDEEYFANFVPVLRMGVCSDIHCYDDATYHEKNMEKVVKTSYEYAEKAYGGYDKLDAVLVAGDVAEAGTEAQFKRFYNSAKKYLKEGTQLISIIGNHEFFNSNGQTAVDRYLQYSGEPEFQHVVLNGFHIVTTHSSFTGAYGGAQIAWLEQEIQKAIAETPDKPVFVMVHEQPKDTCFGSATLWGNAALAKLLKKYPQTVCISGHSHYPIYDPRSIWQDDFTSINTGSLAYHEYALNGVAADGVYMDAVDSTGGYVQQHNMNSYAGDMMVIEVDAYGALRIVGYDVYRDCELFVRTVRSTTDPSKFVTNEQKNSNYPALVFPESSELTQISATGEALTFSFPRLKTEGDVVVESYRAKLYQNGTLVQTKVLMGAYMAIPIPETMKCTFEGLAPETEYTVKIYPVNPYGTVSNSCLTATGHTGSATGELLFETSIDEKGVADTVSGASLMAYGNATTVYSEDLGAYVAQSASEEQSNYSYKEWGTMYSQIADEITVEVYFKLDNTQTTEDKFVGVFSNQEDAGFGYEYHINDGKLKFYLRIGTASACDRVECNVEKEQWIHAVATRKNNKLTLYLNGKKIDEVSVELDNITMPKAAGQQLVVGGDSSREGMGRYSADAQIAYAAVYNTAKTAAQVSDLYAARTAK